MTFTRRQFLAFLGAAAGSAVAAPLLARFDGVPAEVPVSFTKLDLQSLNACLEEVYGRAAMADLIYMDNAMFRKFKGAL